MRDTHKEIHRKQYIQFSIFFIPSCIESHDIYYFNILRIITLLYHFYIEHEIYDMSHLKIETILMKTY